MSYEIRPNVGYRMPTHFGPAPGPRQQLLEGGSVAQYDSAERPRVKSTWVSFRTEVARIARHLPPGLEPAPDPLVHVCHVQFRDLPWLAGRGYDIFQIGIASTTRDHQHGQLVAVIWENHADPIITGRDELATPKLYAEISTLGPVSEGRVQMAASWDGFQFLDMELWDLQETPALLADEVLFGHRFFYHFVPKLNATGGAEIAKLIVCPPAGIGHSGRAVACWRGKGRVAFRHGTFEQLPTLFHVVNALADFEILEVTEAGMVETVGRATRFAGPDPIAR